jgi:hypothetical protein
MILNDVCQLHHLTATSADAVHVDAFLFTQGSQVSSPLLALTCLKHHSGHRY